MEQKKIIAFAIGPILNAALALVTLPIIAWYFSPEDVGRNNIFQIYISFSILIYVLGLDQAYVREYHESKDKISLLYICFLPGLLLILFLCLVSIPFSSKLANLLFGKPNASWYVVTSCCVLLTYISRFFSLILRMQTRGMEYSASQFIPKISIIALLLFYNAFNVDNNYINLLFINLLSLVSLTLITGWSTREDWMQFQLIKMSWSDLRRLLNFGFPLIGAGLAYWGLSATSTLVMRIYSTFEELAVYSVAMSFSGVALILQSIFATIWMPLVYKWVAENKNIDKIKKVADLVYLLVCQLFFLAGAFCWLVDFILPSSYLGVKYILVAVMAQPLLYTLSETTVIGINVYRKTKYAFLVALFSFVINVVLSIALVPHYGAAGAAISNAFAYLVFFIARTEISARYWKIGNYFFKYFYLVLILSLAAATALGGRDYYILNSAIWAVCGCMLIFSKVKRMKALYLYIKLQ